jgi:hypothetical protein
MAVSAEQLADDMYELVKEYQGKKKFKAQDLIKAMKEKHGAGEVDRKTGKEALKVLMDSGRCVYTYFGGSYVEIPHKEGAAGGEDED